MATIGSYKGVAINAGTDAEVAAQMAAIDGGTISKAVPVTQTTENNPKLASISSQIQGIAAQIPALTANVNAVTSGNLNNTQQPVNLPTQTDTTTPQYQNAITSGASLTAPVSTDTMPSWLQKYLDTQTPPPSSTDAYNSAYNNSGIQGANADVLAKQNEVKQAQSDLLDTQAQLKAITDQAATIPMQLMQGADARGVTTSQLGKQENSRLRTVALQAIPLQSQILLQQAKIASAQGNLDYAQGLQTQAQDKMNTLFKLQSEDATNLYNYKQKLIDTVFSYADKEQQTALAQQQTLQTQTYNTQQNNLNYTQSVASTAIANGQSDIATSIMKLNSSSPTYMQDVASLAGSIQPKTTTTTSTTGSTKFDLNTAIADMSSQLSSVIGGEGYISKEDWARALNAWTSAGGKSADFIANFKYLANSGNPDYVYQGLE